MCGGWSMSRAESTWGKEKKKKKGKFRGEKKKNQNMT